MAVNPATAKMPCFLSGHDIPKSYKIKYIKRTRHKHGIKVEEYLAYVGKCLDCGESAVNYHKPTKLIRKYVLWFRKKGES